MDFICPFQNGDSTILNNSRFLNLYLIIFLLRQADKNKMLYKQYECIDLFYE